MIKLSTKLPKDIYVAVSGGLDSMAALAFLAKKHNVTAIHVNHNEGNSNDAEALVYDYCYKNNISLLSTVVDASIPKNISLEEFWRIERYKVFHSVDGLVITCHHLNDCVETWLWSSFNGQGKLIPYANKNVIRPFLQTSRADFEYYANKHNIPYIEDESNLDLTRARNYIRKVILPNVKQINPGIEATILKKLKNNENGNY